MKTETFKRTAFLLFLAVVTIAFIWLVRDFLLTILMAAVFAGFAAPLYMWFLRKVRGHKAPASLLTLVTLIFLVGIPVFAFIGVLTNEAIKVSNAAVPWIQKTLDEPGGLTRLMSQIPGYDVVAPHRDEILKRVGSMVSRLGEWTVALFSAFTTGTVTFFIHMLLMLYAMFFLFMHGAGWLRQMLYYLPLPHDQEMKLLKSFQSMTRATIKGTLIVGFVEGVLLGLALGLAGIPSPVFWGTVMAVASILPAVGPTMVWLPAGVILIVQGDMTAGVLLLIWCALVAGAADNFLRPVLIGKDTKMNELMVLISTLGGIILFGVPGFIIGPIIASLFLTTWGIYGDVFKDALPPVKSIPGSVSTKH